MENTDFWPHPRVSDSEGLGGTLQFAFLASSQRGWSSNPGTMLPGNTTLMWSGRYYHGLDSWHQKAVILKSTRHKENTASDSDTGLGGILFGYASYFTRLMSQTDLHFIQKKMTTDACLANMLEHTTWELSRQSELRAVPISYTYKRQHQGYLFGHLFDTLNLIKLYLLNLPSWIFWACSSSAQGKQCSDLTGKSPKALLKVLQSMEDKTPTYL